MQAAEREATVEDEEMKEPVSADTLQQAAVQRQAAFAAKKKVRLEKPLAANDKGMSTCCSHRQWTARKL